MRILLTLLCNNEGTLSTLLCNNEGTQNPLVITEQLMSQLTRQRV